MHSTVIIVEIHVGDDQFLAAVLGGLDDDVICALPLQRGARGGHIAAELHVARLAVLDPCLGDRQASRRVEPVARGGHLALGQRGGYQRRDEQGPTSRKSRSSQGRPRAASPRSR